MKKSRIRNRLIAVTAVISGLVAVSFGVPVLRAANTVTLTLSGSGYPEPIGIDWLPLQDELLISTCYSNGTTGEGNVCATAHNFEHVLRTTFGSSPWGTQSGWNDEIYFSSVRSGQGTTWTVGDVFSAQGDRTGTPPNIPAGSGDVTKIARFDSTGTLVNPIFATLAGETKRKRGAVVFDRFGVAGNNLIAVASNDENSPSSVWRVTSVGAATKLMLTGPGTTAAISKGSRLSRILRPLTARWPA